MNIIPMTASEKKLYYRLMKLFTSAHEQGDFDTYDLLWLNFYGTL